MKKWYKICGVVNIFLTFSLFSTAQNVENKLIKLNPSRFFLTQKTVPQFPKTLTLPQNSKKNQKNIFLNISPSAATQGYGFFCRAELKTDAVLKIPVRFRLGSLPYCDYMEGKNAHLKMTQ